MKKLLLVFMSIALFGCAAQQVDKNLASFTGVTYEDYEGEYKMLKSFTVQGTTSKNINDINVCLLQNIENDDVKLTDSSKSFVGSYSGNYYNVTSGSTSSGGSVQQYSDDKTIVIKGLTKYKNPQSWVPITNYVRYTLTVKKDKTNLNYTFSNIKQAQAETGYVANNGFNPIGNWDGANPSVILKTLENEVSKVSACLNDN
ncbi:hypothetical protein DES39_1157 [Orbus hercynius]|uniref:DUF4468 domain-containing protein n=1 Tax=Orbus hercynius TaxID=593135 RepID=A0A495RET6_9GAMM|nr:hypothetical protein [Orbus hercynius]RKS85744.1 hypothetical protein DES39_1157 [Orbus hercynius]